MTAFLRIPNCEIPDEVRQAFQTIEGRYIDWTNATEDLLTTGTITGGTIVGANVTSGLDPGHTHTTFDEKVKVDAAATAGYLGNTYANGVIRTDGIDKGISYVDGGDYIQLAFDINNMFWISSSANFKAIAFYWQAEFCFREFSSGRFDKIRFEDLEGALTIANLGGAADFILVDGTRDFSGVIVGVDPTASNHLATKEYVDSAIHFITEYFLTDTASGSYFEMVDQSTGEAESSDPTGSITQSNGQALTEWTTVSGVPGMTFLEHGVYSVHVHAEKTGGGARDVEIYFEVYTRTSPGGAETLRMTSEISGLITAKAGLELHAVLIDDVTTDATDLIVVKLLANGVSGGNDATITLYMEGTNASHFAMPTSSEILDTIFLRQDGTKALTGNLAVDPGVTIDGRDIRLDGGDLDLLVSIIGKAKIDAAATVDYLGAASNDGILRASTGITYADGGNFVTISTNDGEIDHNSLSNTHNLTTDIDHDALTNYVGDEHVAHGDVTLTAGSGLTGGGTIAANRSFALDINGLAAVTPIVAADEIPFWDDTAGANKKITFANFVTSLGASTDKLVGIDAGATPGYLGATAGAGVLRTEAPLTYTDGGDFVTLGCDTLTLIDSDVTLYLETTGNDTTGDGSSGDPWLTLDKALTYLSDKSIATDATVTIQFGDGTHTRTATDIVNHPNGDRINIVGENTHSITMTSVQSSSGSRGAWAVIINVSSVANVAVNDYVMFPAAMTGGTRPETMCGCWIVTNVDVPNTRITVTSTHDHTAAPAAAVSGTLTVLKTILQYNGVGGIQVTSSLGLLNKLALSGNGSGYGIEVIAQGKVTGSTALGIVYFSVNLIVLDQAQAILNYVAISSAASVNVRVLYGLVVMKNGVSSGGGAQGAYMSTGQLDAQAGVISGNVTQGVLVQWMSFASVYGAKVMWNRTHGLFAQGNAFIRAQTATVTNNGTNFSPAVNTAGNQESYIFQ